MQTATLYSVEARQGATTEQFPPLELVTRPHVPTEQAAYYLNRRPQTLRGWAMDGRVIQPHRINGRLAWPVSSIKEVLGVSK
jgi:hypothetical protein